MLKYLNQTLGLTATVTPWGRAKRLPIYLQCGKKYSLLQIENVSCVLIEVDEKEFNLAAFRKQLDKIPNQSMPIVLCFNYLEFRRRKTLIEARLPFIVPNYQIYLPFLGVVFQEHIKATNKVAPVPQRLSPTAQLVLLYFIYKPEGYRARKVDLSKQLNISAMNVTRAVQELLALNFLSVEKTGRCDWVSITEQKKTLFEKAYPYMIDPVKKRFYVLKNESISVFPLAGEYALAARSVLSEPAIECRAISYDEYKNFKEVEKIDPAWSSRQDYVQLEYWKYDPKALSQSSSVDVISLAMSFRDNYDERIEEAVDNMLEGFEW